MSLIRIAEIPNAGPRGALASSANIGMPSFSGMRVEHRTAQATGAAMLSDASSRRAAQGMVAQTLQLDAFSAEARAGMALGRSIGQIGQVAQQIGEKFARAKDTADIARGETILRSAFEKQVNEQLDLPVEEWQANWQRNLNTAKKALSEVKFSNNAMEQFGPSWERWSSLSGLQIENMARKKQIEGYRMDVEANAMMKVANEDYAGAFSVIDRSVADGIFSEPEGNLMKARMEDNIYRQAEEANYNRVLAEINKKPARMMPLLERRSKGEDVPELGKKFPQAQATTLLDHARGLLRTQIGDMDDAADQAVLTGEIKDEKTLREKYPGLPERRILARLNDMKTLWEASPEAEAQSAAELPKIAAEIENYNSTTDPTLEKYFALKDRIDRTIAPSKRAELKEMLSSVRREGSKLPGPIKDALSTLMSPSFDKYFAPDLDEKDLKSDREDRRNRAVKLMLEGAARRQEKEQLLLQYAKENPAEAGDPAQVSSFMQTLLAPESADAASKLFDQKTTERAASDAVEFGTSVYGIPVPASMMKGKTPPPQGMAVAFGYPVASAKQAGVEKYFQDNPNVAGMAWGGGMNGSPKDEPRVIIPNPYNPNMADPVKAQGLLKLEAARHVMDERGYVPKFKVTKEQQEWRKTLGPYADDDVAFKQSIISRLIVNDDVPGATEEQKEEAAKVSATMGAAPRSSTRQPASIRNNNAGAMWPASWQKKFGGEFGQNLNDGKGNKIAKFPTPVHGAAATMYLLGSNRLMYSKKTLKDAIAKWSNASGSNLTAYVNAFTKAGFGADEKMADIMADEGRAIAFTKVMSRFEAGQDYPLNNDQWAAAYRMFLQQA